MKGLYHLCYTSHSEVICRNNNDYERLVCRLAQTSISTASQILAYAVMSTHVHLIILTDSPSDFLKRLRHSYTTSFNHKYFRKGTLGEKNYYGIRLKGIEHITAAISYVLRNPVHHNVATNPFSYPYSTANLYFRSDMEKIVNEVTYGNTVSKRIGIDRKNWNNSECLYRKAACLKGIVSFLDTGGVDPLSFVEVGMVENYFGTYNAYQYNLHRRDYQDWKRAQLESDSDESPITIARIEPWMNQKQVADFEKKPSRWHKEEQISDIELCSEIDKEILRLHKSSYVHLSREEKIAISTKIRMQHPYAIKSEQFARCFGGWN